MVSRANSYNTLIQIPRKYVYLYYTYTHCLVHNIKSKNNAPKGRWENEIAKIRTLVGKHSFLYFVST